MAWPEETRPCPEGAAGGAPGKHGGRALARLFLDGSLEAGSGEALRLPCRFLLSSFQDVFLA